MATIQAVTEILKRAEEKLAALAAKASSAREYETASGVLRLALDVKELGDQAQSLMCSKGPQPSPSAGAGISPAPVSAGRGAKAPRARRKGAYPEFLRRGNNLIKIGWSKTQKREYQHKAPRPVLDALMMKLEVVGNSGRTFTMAEILPLMDTEGNELPHYQVYVWVAWLRSTAVLKQHGRRGYSCEALDGLPARIDGAWKTMAEGSTRIT